MQTNQAGLDLIRSFESCSLTAYQCSAGVWTIGWGHTGPDVHPGKVITQAEADQLFVQDIAEREPQVAAMVPPGVNENQFSALMSFAYNVGLDALRKSTLLRKLRTGDAVGAANEFPRWNRSKGRVLNGLTRRRNAERALFLASPVRGNL